MKVSRIEAHLVRVPFDIFDMGASPKAFAGMNWTSVDSLFVRVRTEQGIEGWGEGWGHVACPTTLAALSSLGRERELATVAKAAGPDDVRRAAIAGTRLSATS